MTGPLRHKMPSKTTKTYMHPPGLSRARTDTSRLPPPGSVRWAMATKCWIRPLCYRIVSGQGIRTRRMHTLDVRHLASKDAYSLLCGAIVPRPIGLISTHGVGGSDQDGTEHDNLAPLSFFMPVSSNPCALAFSLTRKRDGSKKDSLCNIEVSGEFVVNHVTKDIFEQVYTAGTWGTSDGCGPRWVTLGCCRHRVRERGERIPRDRFDSHPKHGCAPSEGERVVYTAGMQGAGAPSHRWCSPWSLHHGGWPDCVRTSCRRGVRSRQYRESGWLHSNRVTVGRDGIWQRECRL